MTRPIIRFYEEDLQPEPSEETLANTNFGEEFQTHPSKKLFHKWRIYRLGMLYEFMTRLWSMIFLLLALPTIRKDDFPRHPRSLCFALFWRVALSQITGMVAVTFTEHWRLLGKDF